MSEQEGPDRPRSCARRATNNPFSRSAICAKQRCTSIPIDLTGVLLSLKAEELTGSRTRETDSRSQLSQVSRWEVKYERDLSGQCVERPAPVAPPRCPEPGRRTPGQQRDAGVQEVIPDTNAVGELHSRFRKSAVQRHPDGQRVEESHLDMLTSLHGGRSTSGNPHGRCRRRPEIRWPLVSVGGVSCSERSWCPLVRPRAGR